jgi:phosphatidylglycerol lysyltransferase
VPSAMSDRPVKSAAAPAEHLPTSLRTAAESVATRTGPSRWWWVSPAVICAVFVAATVVLRRELLAYSYHDVLSDLWSMPTSRLLLAIGATIAAYAVLPGYDWLALRYVGRRLPLRQVALASCIAYALSQTLGFPIVTGGSVRFRFWSSWGLDTTEIGQAVSFAGLTFTLGMVLVVCTALLLEPQSALVLLHVPVFLARTVGAIGVAAIAFYLWWSATSQTALRIRGWTFPVPPLHTAAGQLVLACLDWSLAGLVLYALLPPTAPIAFLPFLGVFLVAQVAGVVSHVPGGLGVFETLMVLTLTPTLSAPPVVAALVGFRVLYYFAPFVLGVVALAGAEVARHRAHVARGFTVVVGRWLPTAMPLVLSLVIFAAGVVLLVSGATPAVHSRISLITDLLPLSVIEFSHFTGSVVGAALLVLAWATRRRVRIAWAATVVLLAIGVVASLLKGLDWEEALLLGVVLAVVLPARSAFDRPAALLHEPLSADWLAAVVAVVLGTLGLVLFVYKHVEYRDSLWWYMGPNAHAARSLRALVGAGGVLAAFGALRLFSPAPVTPATPSAQDLADAARIADASSDSEAWLSVLGDKALLFNEARTAFIMYAVEGRSWVALRDPVGPPEAQADLAWQFKEEALRHGGWPVFYEVSAANLPLYVDLGLTLQKLGEEAIVPVTEFSLVGGARSGFRRTIKEVERTGATFVMHPVENTPALLPALRRVSDAWREKKPGREKGFSLGYFDEEYLKYFPIATVERDGEIVAFANVWLCRTSGAISPDLMRYSSHAPSGSMEYLFLQLMLWAQREGYSEAQLGMAPMSGFETRAVAPVWHKIGALLYRHGEHFYNFRGLRAYKEKFRPEWSPRYLACPGGLALPRILANVASLISGGVSGIVRR